MRRDPAGAVSCAALSDPVGKLDQQAVRAGHRQTLCGGCGPYPAGDAESDGDRRDGQLRQDQCEIFPEYTAVQQI